jgi:hypothetical protein
MMSGHELRTSKSIATRKSTGRIPAGTASPIIRGERAKDTSEMPAAAIAVEIPVVASAAVRMEYTGGNVVMGAGIVP